MQNIRLNTLSGDPPPQRSVRRTEPHGRRPSIDQVLFASPDLGVKFEVTL